MVRVRPAEAQDVTELATLYRLVLGDQGPNPGTTLSAMLERGLVLCAEEDGTLVGLGTARVAADECEIHTVGVAPSARRAGIGRRLVEALERAAVQAGASSCFLEVREDNSAARALYTAAGYTQCGQRPKYYRDGENAILMHRTIPESVCGR